MSSKKENRARKIIRNLRPIDDALFAVLAEDKAVIQEMLRVFLSDDKLVVTEVIPQRSIANLLGRAIRLDALCRLGDGRRCNVEIQRADNDDHLRRVRYNASGITWSATNKGTKFSDVPDVCVIYISEFDFLGGGCTIYHVDNVIRETGQTVDNGLEMIFINANIADGSKIADLMRCFLQSNVSNPEFPALSKKMDEIKNTEKGVNEMSSVIERYYQEDLQKEKTKIEMDTIARLVEKGLLSIEQGAQELGISKEKMQAILSAQKNG